MCQIPAGILVIGAVTVQHSSTIGRFEYFRSSVLAACALSNGLGIVVGRRERTLRMIGEAVGLGVDIGAGPLVRMRLER